MDFKKHRAIARKLVQKAKNDYWLEYLNQIDTNISTKRVWPFFMHFRVFLTGTQAIHLKTPNNDIMSSEVEVAQLFAEKYAAATSTSTPNCSRSIS